MRLLVNRVISERFSAGHGTFTVDRKDAVVTLEDLKVPPKLPAFYKYEFHCLLMVLMLKS